MNKAHDNKQNWSIYPVQEHENSKTKQVGEQAKSPVRNDSNINFLRSTNLPFLKNANEDFLTRTQGKAHGPADKPEVAAGKHIGAEQFKSRVPFSPTQRHASQDLRETDRKGSLATSTFTWKTPQFFV